MPVLLSYRNQSIDLKVETIKRLSPRLKCYCFSHSGAPRIQSFFLSANHDGRQYFPLFLGPSTLKSISPALALDCNAPLKKKKVRSRHQKLRKDVTTRSRVCYIAHTRTGKSIKSNLTFARTF